LFAPFLLHLATSSADRLALSSCVLILLNKNEQFSQQVGGAWGAAVRLALVVVVVRAVDEKRILWHLPCLSWRDIIDLFLCFFFWQRQ